MSDTSSEIHIQELRTTILLKKEKSVFFSEKYGFMHYICSIQKYDSKSYSMGNE